MRQGGDPDPTAWCVFRNLVQAVYREARWLGPAGDMGAKLVVRDRRYAAPAERCRRWRDALESTTLYEETADARSAKDVLRPYVERIGLLPQDLVVLFDRSGWHPHGGPKWGRSRAP